MDTDAIRARIDASKLLTEQEKEYWHTHLEQLSDDQREKLDDILTEAEAVQWSPQIDTYIDTIAQGQDSSSL